MDSATQVRAKLTYFLLAIGAALFLFGLLFDSSWTLLGAVMGVGLFLTGAVMFTSLSVVRGVPWLTQLISRHVEPVWDGEILYTDGSAFKIRYDFDGKGSPWFVASDVCIAVGAKAPEKGDLKCGGVPLLMNGGHIIFSEASVQTYLTSLAISNHDASRLLVNIRNNVLRKLEKQRDEKKRYG